MSLQVRPPYSNIHGIEDEANMEWLEEQLKLIEEGLPKPGDLKPTAVAVAPKGWLLCEGQEVLIVNYPALYAALGSKESSPGKFALPDGRNRTLIGASAERALGTKGGVAVVKLTSGQMPVHGHPPKSGQAFVVAKAGGPNNVVSGAGIVVDKEAANQGTTGESGGGESHENMPPYFVGNWLIKT